MARKDTRYNREASDEAYNARRRFARKAKRYADMAEKATGEVRARYETIARDALEDAMSTYEKGTTRKEMSKNIRELDERLKPLDVFRREPKKRITKKQQERSIESLYSRDEETRRKEEAKSILNTGVGSRIYAGTIEVWGELDYSEREQAIVDYFGVNDMLDVIKMFEKEFGEELYAELKNTIKYDELVGMIAEYAASYSK